MCVFRTLTRGSRRFLCCHICSDYAVTFRYTAAHALPECQAVMKGGRRPRRGGALRPLPLHPARARLLAAGRVFAPVEVNQVRRCFRLVEDVLFLLGCCRGSETSRLLVNCTFPPGRSSSVRLNKAVPSSSAAAPACTSCSGGDCRCFFTQSEPPTFPLLLARPCTLRSNHSLEKVLMGILAARRAVIASF